MAQTITLDEHFADLYREARHRVSVAGLGVTLALRHQGIDERAPMNAAVLEQLGSRGAYTSYCQDASRRAKAGLRQFPQEPRTFLEAMCGYHAMATLANELEQITSPYNQVNMDQVLVDLERADGTSLGALGNTNKPNL